MNIFADSSFFLSVIGGDSHTKAATTALAKHEGHFCSTAIVVFESRNRIHKWKLDGSFDQAEAERLVRSLELLATYRFIILREVSLKKLAANSQRLIEHFSKSIPHGSMDVLHVGAACALRCDTFVTFDKNQRALAVAAGLSVLPGG